jgi:cytochrome P450
MGKIRSETPTALSASKLVPWQAQVEASALALIDSLPVTRPVDIVQEFARPWSLATAIIVTGANPDDSGRLDRLAGQISLASADPSNSTLQSDVMAASTELEQLLQKSAIPMNGPVFVALSQTLPSFLANAWLALLRHPAELALLCREPNLMPSAIEELLRYAGHYSKGLTLRHRACDSRRYLHRPRWTGNPPVGFRQPRSGAVSISELPRIDAL